MGVHPFEGGWPRSISKAGGDSVPNGSSRAVGSGPGYVAVILGSSYDSRVVVDKESQRRIRVVYQEAMKDRHTLCGEVTLVTWESLRNLSNWVVG